MPPSQQRRNNARGRINARDIPRLDMSWVLFSATTTQVRLTVEAGTVPFRPGGVLQAVIVETGEIANYVTGTGQQIVLGFNAVPHTPCTLRIPANDGAVRNRSGGFLQGGTVALNPIPPRAAFLDTLVGGNLSAVNTLLYGGGTETFTIPTATDTAMQFILAVESSGTQATLEEEGGYTVGVLTAGQLTKVAFNGLNWAFYPYPG
jgi:hypothetical protein